MLTDTETAAAGLYGQLQALYPRARKRQLWHMIGVTEMPGIDDFGPDETFSTTDAVALLHWADRQGIGFLSFWALQRDNGGCPGTKGAGNCSGVTQPQWYFSHVFEPFSRFMGGDDRWPWRAVIACSGAIVEVSRANNGRASAIIRARPAPGLRVVSLDRPAPTRARRRGRRARQRPAHRATGRLPDPGCGYWGDVQLSDSTERRRAGRPCWNRRLGKASRSALGSRRSAFSSTR